MEFDDQPDHDVSSAASLSPSLRPVSIDHDLLDEPAEPSRHHKRHSIASDSDFQLPAPHPVPLSDIARGARSRPIATGPKRISTTIRPSLPINMLPSAPASPPTPAPSPTPFQQRSLSWHDAETDEDALLREMRHKFAVMSDSQRQRLLAEVLNMCSSNQLSFVAQFVSPRLKKDPFEHLPDELCLRVSLSLCSLLVHVTNPFRSCVLSMSRGV